MTSNDPHASERKLKAKRHKEHIKLSAAFFNTPALAIIAAAFIVQA